MLESVLVQDVVKPCKDQSQSLYTQWYRSLRSAAPYSAVQVCRHLAGVAMTSILFCPFPCCCRLRARSALQDRKSPGDHNLGEKPSFWEESVVYRLGIYRPTGGSVSGIFELWKQCPPSTNYSWSYHWCADSWVLLVHTWYARKVLSEKGARLMGSGDSGFYGNRDGSF